MESTAPPPAAPAKLLVPALQVLSALRIYGRIGSGPAPGWLGGAHRISGTLAFLVSLPVAYHCLWALGFQDATTRVLIHSFAGCFFFDTFGVPEF